MTEEFMKEEKQITSQFDNDPLLKLKSREVDLRAMENERKKQNDEATQDLNRAKLMQAQEIAEDKLEQNEDLAKLRAGVSLAKTGVQQAQVMVETKKVINKRSKKRYSMHLRTKRTKKE